MPLYLCAYISGPLYLIGEIFVRMVAVHSDQNDNYAIHIHIYEYQARKIYEMRNVFLKN